MIKKLLWEQQLNTFYLIVVFLIIIKIKIFTFQYQELSVMNKV